MATNTFKVSRGSYLSLKRTSGKDSNTLYFGYDGPNLGGIFVGDREITSTLKDAVFRVNASNSRYLDLVIQNVDSAGKMYKSAFKLFNTPIIEAELTNMQASLSTLRTDVDDISTRLSNFQTTTAQQFAQANEKFTKIDNHFTQVDSSINIVEKSGGGISVQKVQWVDLD